MGGNETLVIRMSEWLIAQGHWVTIVTAQGGFLADKLPRGCRNYIIGSTDFGAAVIPGWPFSKDVKRCFRDADVVMSFSSGGCMFSYHLMRSTASNSKLIAGVFHPNTGVTKGKKHYFDWVFQDGVYDQNKVYMNAAIREIHEAEVGRAFDN